MAETAVEQPPAAPLQSSVKSENGSDIVEPSPTTETSSVPSLIPVPDESDAWSTKEWKEKFKHHLSVPVIEARDFFEKFMKAFPFAGAAHVKIAERELEAKNIEQVESLLKRWLPASMSLDVWKFYIKFVKLTKLQVALESSDERQITQARNDMVQAYQFALQYVGFTLPAGEIWKSYIDYVQTTEAETDYLQSLKRTNLRRIFREAVTKPVNNIDTLWQEYESFENNLNRTTATSLIGELQQTYMEARNLVKDRRTLVDAIGPAPGPEYLPPKPSGTQQEESLVNLWKQVIGFEFGNPERLTEKVDRKQRIRYIYSQALSQLQFFPEIWYEFASYERATQDNTSARVLLSTALSTIPNSLFLRFAAADFEEGLRNLSAAKEIYEATFKSAPCPLVFIQYIRFARRTEGIDAARKVFSRSRSHSSCDYSVYVAAALLEYRVNKNVDVARNIFELGMGYFSEEVPFLLEFVQFVQSLNNENDARATYERAIACVSGEESLPIWQKYRDFETQWAGSDLVALESLERRMAEKFPELDELRGMLGVIHRFALADALPVDASDVSYLRRNAQLTASTGMSSNVHHETITNTNGEEDDFETPAFLDPLIEVLPTTLRGAVPDPDFALRRLRDRPLPPKRPEEPTEMKDSMSRKRKNPGDGATVNVNRDAQCAFQVRQSRVGGA